MVEVKAVILIRSPRDLPEVKEAFDKIDFVDKVWFKYFDVVSVINFCNDFVINHPEYTHYIISSDDIIPTPEVIRRLLRDVEEEDYPVISGCCNWCDLSHGPCPMCESGESHGFINITVEPIDYKNHLLTRKDYQFLQNGYRRENQKVIQCWFQGHALAIIRRDIIRSKVKLRIGYQEDIEKSYEDGQSTFKHDWIWEMWGADDLCWALDCAKMGIKQYCDLRAFVRHIGNKHSESKVGKEQPKIVYEKVGEPITETPIFVYPRLLICTPFNNEENSLEGYEKGLLDINYPKSLIDLFWFENDSTDKTWECLVKLYKKFKYLGYRSVHLMSKTYGLERLGKIENKDLVIRKFGTDKGFGIPHFGKNYVHSSDDILARAERLRDIYHMFFEFHRQRYSKNYFVLYNADSIPRPNIFVKMILDFMALPDAGWIGGIVHQRHPMEYRFLYRYGGLGSPHMIDHLKRPRYSSDEEILELQLQGKRIFECAFCGQLFMLSPDVILEGAELSMDGYDTVMGIVDKIWRMNKKVYCDSDIYVEHISMDGKVYRRNLYEEIEKKKRVESFEEKKKLLKIWLTSQSRCFDTTATLEEFEEFKNKIFPKGIPARPMEGKTIFDQPSREYIDSRQWDEKYGKYRKWLD